MDEPSNGTDFLQQCLADRGVEVGRSGEADGAAGAGLDVEGEQLEDPATLQIMRECAAATTERFPTGDMDPSRSAAGVEGDDHQDLELHVAAFHSCMEGRGFHPTRSELAEGEEMSDGGIITDFPPDELEDPDFSSASEECEILAASSAAALNEGAG